MNRCITHHYACDCREEMFRKVEGERDEWARRFSDLRHVRAESGILKQIIQRCIECGLTDQLLEDDARAALAKEEGK